MTSVEGVFSKSFSAGWAVYAEGLAKIFAYSERIVVPLI